MIKYSIVCSLLVICSSINGAQLNKLQAADQKVRRIVGPNSLEYCDIQAPNSELWAGMVIGGSYKAWNVMRDCRGKIKTMRVPDAYAEGRFLRLENVFIAQDRAKISCSKGPHCVIYQYRGSDPLKLYIARKECSPLTGIGYSGCKVHCLNPSEAKIYFAKLEEQCPQEEKDRADRDLQQQQTKHKQEAKQGLS